VSVSVGSFSNTEHVETRLWTRRLVVWCVILLGLVLMLYASVIKALVVQWWTDADYGYGFFVPLFSGYILWRERERWKKRNQAKPFLDLWCCLGVLACCYLVHWGLNSLPPGSRCWYCLQE
jgi:hypothetical protein